jgi:hypothetical protein
MFRLPVGYSFEEARVWNLSRTVTGQTYGHGYVLAHNPDHSYPWGVWEFDDSENCFDESRYTDEDAARADYSARQSFSLEDASSLIEQY